MCPPICCSLIMYNVSGFRSICFSVVICLYQFRYLSKIIQRMWISSTISQYLLLLIRFLYFFFLRKKTIYFDFLGSELKPLSLLKLFMMSTLNSMFSKMVLLFLYLQCTYINVIPKNDYVWAVFILKTLLIAIRNKITV